ncbi:MAG: GNAT family N-acetyltransferase [Candidatus Nanoarchaeia archaeon]|jgi:N-acetylglutamate synthase-like GNAT family acetyltransferase
MKIRKFKKEDAKRVAYIIHKAIFEVNSKHYSKRICKNLWKGNTPAKLIEKSKIRDMFVIEKDKVILGTASLSSNLVRTVFVNPRYHGKGVGRKLMNHIEIVAKKKGLKKLQFHSSLNAEGFYKKLGYKKIRKEYHKEFGRSILMQKKL